MTSRKITILALAGCMLLLGAENASAFSGIMNDWQNYYNVCAPLETASCDACHQNGFNFNSYGADLETRIAGMSMANIAAFIDVEPLDSDGDGITNGQEIVVDCTAPWDNTDNGVVAVESDAWGALKALFR